MEPECNASRYLWGKPWDELDDVPNWHDHDELDLYAAMEGDDGLPGLRE